MNTCVVCGNSIRMTQYTRPELVYHKFPTNANLRRKWLEVLRLDHCSDSQCVCSDHFLKENYKPGMKIRVLFRNTIPQPYDKKCDQNYKYFPRTKTKNNQIPTVIKTDVEPELTDTKDRPLKYKPYCTVKKCFNKTSSKELSFFGYPKEVTLRKKWMSRTGLVVNPTTHISHYYRVCSAHFEDCCFYNAKKNRLRAGAIPTLFMGDDIIDLKNIPSTSSPVNSGFFHVIDASNIPSTSSLVNSGMVHVNDSRNVPSTSSPVNSGFVHVNKTSCSSSDYAANVESKNTSLLVYIISTNRSNKDLETNCSIPGCKTNTDVDDVDKIQLFTPPIELVYKWSLALGLLLNVNCYICEKHFRPQDLIYGEILVNGLYETVKSLVPSALPIPINAVGSVSNASNNLPDNTDKCSKSITSMTIDDFSTIEPNLKQKLKNISVKNSLSITMEPTENSKVIEPSVDLFSKMSAKCSVSITLEPKLKDNIFSTANNSSPYDSLTHSLPSTSSCSVYNKEAITQQSSLQSKPEATSTLKMQDKLSSNTVICPEFIDSQITSLKPISSKNKSNSDEFLEIMSPLIIKSDTHSTNSSPCEIIDCGNTKKFKKRDHGFILEISKTVILPSSFWKSFYNETNNATTFSYELFSKTIEKKIVFPNSLVPIVQLYGKNYKYKKRIESRNKLQDFLEKIDNLEKCSGFDYQKCIGYFDGSSEDTLMCSACQEKITDQEIQSKFKSMTIQRLKSKVSLLDYPKY